MLIKPTWLAIHASTTACLKALYTPAQNFQTSVTVEWILQAQHLKLLRRIAHLLALEIRHNLVVEQADWTCSGATLPDHRSTLAMIHGLLPAAILKEILVEHFQMALILWEALRTWPWVHARLPAARMDIIWLVSSMEENVGALPPLWMEELLRLRESLDAVNCAMAT